MCAQKMKIYLKQNAIPYRVSAPLPIPLRFQEPANSEIACYIASGVTIPCDEPTEWCSPAFFVPKEDGKRVRLVTDYTRLNKFVVRPFFDTASSSETRETHRYLKNRHGIVHARGGGLLDHPCAPCCLLYTSPSPRDRQKSRMPSSA